MILLELYQHLGTKRAKLFKLRSIFPAHSDLPRELAAFTKCKKKILKEQLAGVMDANTREGGVL